MLKERLNSGEAERASLLSELESSCQTSSQEMKQLQSHVMSVSEERDQLQEILKGLREENKQLKAQLEDSMDMVHLCSYKIIGNLKAVT